MDFKFLEVKEEKQIGEMADMAKEIWLEYFPRIITEEQVRFMIERFQSKEAVTEQILNGGYNYFTVFGGGEALGYLALKAEGNRLLLSKLYFKKEHRGRGYFGEMLSFAEKFAGKKGIYILYLIVNKHNDASIAVYRKKGFDIIEERVTDIGNGFVMDDYVMKKVITSDRPGSYL